MGTEKTRTEIGPWDLAPSCLVTLPVFWRDRERKSWLVCFVVEIKCGGKWSWMMKKNKVKKKEARKKERKKACRKPLGDRLRFGYQ